MIPEPALERGRRSFFLAVTGHQAGIDIDDQAWQHSPTRGRGRQFPSELGPRQPGTLPSERTRLPQPAQHGLIDSVQDPPRRGSRGDRAEQFRLVSQHHQVRDRLATVCQHHRDIDQHPARIMPRTAPPQPTQRLTEGARHTGQIGQIREQPRPGMRGDTPPISRTTTAGRVVVFCTYEVPSRSDRSES